MERREGKIYLIREESGRSLATKFRAVNPGRTEGFSAALQNERKIAMRLHDSKLLLPPPISTPPLHLRLLLLGASPHVDKSESACILNRCCRVINLWMWSTGFLSSCRTRSSLRERRSCFFSPSLSSGFLSCVFPVLSGSHSFVLLGLFVMCTHTHTHICIPEGCVRATAAALQIAMPALLIAQGARSWQHGVISVFPVVFSAHWAAHRGTGEEKE